MSNFRIKPSFSEFHSQVLSGLLSKGEQSLNACQKVFASLAKRISGVCEFTSRLFIETRSFGKLPSDHVRIVGNSLDRKSLLQFSLVNREAAKMTRRSRLSQLNFMKFDGFEADFQSIMRVVRGAKDSKGNSYVNSIHFSPSMSHNQILEILGECPNIKSLNFLNRSITDIELQAVAEKCPHLNTLSLEGCEEITDVGVQAITETCRDLTSLKLGATYITDVSLHAIAENCKRLEYLDVSFCHKIRSTGIEAIGKASTGLQNVYLVFCRLISEVRIKEINSSHSDLQFHFRY